MALRRADEGLTLLPRDRGPIPGCVLGSCAGRLFVGVDPEGEPLTTSCPCGLSQRGSHNTRLETSVLIEIESPVVSRLKKQVECCLVGSMSL